MITSTTDERRLLSQVGSALTLGVDLVQVRALAATPRELERLVARLLGEFPSARSRVLVNDRLDIALGSGAGGVHLKSTSVSTRRAREQSPPGFLVARSVHDVAEVVTASKEGADFAVFGPVYPTRSKPGHPGAGLETLRAAVTSSRIDVLALGGVTPERVPEIAATGAAGVAGISVFESEAPRSALLEAARAAAALGVEVEQPSRDEP